MIRIEPFQKTRLVFRQPLWPVIGFIWAIMFSAWAATPPGLPIAASAPDPFSIPLTASSAAQKVAVNIDLAGTKTELFPLTEPQNIYALSITGQVGLNNQASSARVLLVDNTQQHEYLVYEAYSSLTDSASFSIQGVCEETCILPAGIPSFSLRIELVDASISIRELEIMDSPRGGQPASLKSLQNAAKIQKLNDQNLGWTAGETSVSNLTYQEKKSLFLEQIVPNLQGFEYYTGGIFEIKAAEPDAASASSLVPNFDWRNRHGKNWVTSVKNQKSCGSCWAFAATGATESLANLYFNQQLNLDLSEQEALSCSGAGSCDGGSPGKTLDYITRTGLVDESCFRYSATDQSCRKCSRPSERIRIGGKITFGSNVSKTEDNLKKLIMDNGPISAGIASLSHAMTLVGFEQDPSDRKTIWIFKNSWGDNWGAKKGRLDYGDRWGDYWKDGYGKNGYAYIKLKMSNIGWTHALKPPVYSLVKSRTVSCVDQDGDKFCNWGISTNKPSTCPSFCKPQKDCDDSNASLGPFDVYYNCKTPVKKTKTFRVYNQGKGELSVTSIQPASNAPWISVSPTRFNVSAGRYQTVSVQVDYSEVPIGKHKTRLLVSSNDPDENPYPNGVYVEVTQASSLDWDDDGIADVLPQDDDAEQPVDPPVEPAITVRLSNISTRAPIEGGIGDIVAGFIISGTGTQQVFLRGFSLETGVDPKLLVQKYPSGDVVAENNNWQDDSRASEVSALPAHLQLTNATDAGLLLDLPAGAYTAILSSGNANGLGLIGVDAVNDPSGVKLTNISTRAPIRGGAYDVIAGFILSGTGNQKVVLRGWGLEAGVDPKLSVQKYPSGDDVASNDNWQTGPNASDIAALPAHLQLSKPTDAGLLLELPAGAYTVILSSVGAKGLGLIGVDAVD